MICHFDFERSSIESRFPSFFLLTLYKCIYVRITNLNINWHALRRNFMYTVLVHGSWASRGGGGCVGWERTPLQTQKKCNHYDSFINMYKALQSTPKLFESC